MTYLNFVCVIFSVTNLFLPVESKLSRLTFVLSVNSDGRSPIAALFSLLDVTKQYQPLNYLVDHCSNAMISTVHQFSCLVKSLRY